MTQEDVSRTSHFFNLRERQRAAWARGGRLLVEELEIEARATSESTEPLAEHERLELILAEVELRRHCGEIITTEEYVNRFPHFASTLLKLSAFDTPLDSCPTKQSRSMEPVAESTSAESISTIWERALTDTLIGASPQSDTVLSSTKSQSAAQKFGRYEVVEEIARGGMGVVFKAHDRELDRVVAIKMIKSGELADEEQIRRFRVEAQAAGRLDHPGIVPVYEVGQEGLQHYLVMAFVDGQSLWQRVKESPLPSRASAKIMLQVGEAIQYAHEKGIIHRDLKPQNILVSSDGFPKVTDFGLAKRNDSDSSLTATGQALGTPSYMPPEQVTGKTDEVRSSADLYSLGATLYCLLTARPPFQGANTLETMRQVIEQEPVPPRQLNRSIPADLETLCLKCLQKDPLQRYRSAAEFVDDLSRYLNDRPIRARPVSQFEHAWRWCRRNPIVAGLTTSAVGLLVLTTVIATIAYLRESQFVVETSKLVDKEQSALKTATANAQRANEEANAAKLQKNLAQHNLYVSHINSAQSAWESGEIGEAIRLLDLYRSPATDEAGVNDPRGFEWYYWDSMCHRDIVTLNHASPVKMVEFSPDGTQLASISIDGTVKMWNVLSGNEILALQVEKNAFHSLSYRANGRQLAVNDGSCVAVFDTQAGQKVLSLETFGQREVWGVCYSPNGQFLASTSGGKICVWDAETGQERISFYDDNDIGINALTYSPDGKRIATGSYDRKIKLWDAATGRKVLIFDGNVSMVTSIAFSPDGQWLAAAGKDLTLKLWNVQTGQRDLTGRFQSTRCLQAMFSRDGRWLAGSGEQNAVKLWDSITGAEIVSHKGHAQWVPYVAISPGGQLLASASFDNTIRVWIAKPYQESVRLPGFENAVHDGAISTDGRRAACAGSLDCFWDVVTGREIDKSNLELKWKQFSNVKRLGLKGPDSLRLQVEGLHLASEESEGIIHVWDDLAGSMTSLPGGNNNYLWAEFNRKGRRLALGNSGSVTIWDPSTGRRLCTLKDLFACLALSADGKRLASAYSNSVAIWDISTGRVTHRLTGHEGNVVCLAFSPTFDRLASVSARAFSKNGDATLKIWDILSGVEVLSINCHADEIAGIAFDPGGDRLATAGGESIKIWDTKTGDQVLTLREANVKAIRFTPDGKQLRSLNSDGCVRFWDGSRGKSTLQLRTNRGEDDINSLKAIARKIVELGGTAEVWDQKESTYSLIKSIPEAPTIDTAIRGINLSGSRIATDEALSFLKHVRQLNSLNLESMPQLDGSFLESIAQLTKLHSLAIGGDENVKGAHFRHLRNLKSLQRLYFARTGFDDIACVSIRHLSDLMLLDIGGTKVTDDGMREISNLKSLRDLNLTDNEITDAGIAHLNSLTELGVLRISGTHVTDMCLFNVAEHPKLETLNLDRTRVSNDGLKRLKRLTSLKILSLDGTSITDEGLAHVCSMTSLRELSLRQTNVSAPGLEAVRAALPNCQIVVSAE